jgi:hypothetical protein
MWWAVQATSTNEEIPITTQTAVVINTPASTTSSTASTGSKLKIPPWSSSYPGSTRRSKHGQPKKPRRQMEFRCMRMHCPGDENIIPLHRPEESDSEDKVESPLAVAETKISTSNQDMTTTTTSGVSSSTLDIKEMRAENERHYKFMKDLEETTDWLSDDEYEEPEMNPKYSSDMFTIANEATGNTNVKNHISKGLSTTNHLFSPALCHQVPILFDLGTTKSIIRPIQAYTEH